MMQTDTGNGPTRAGRSLLQGTVTQVSLPLKHRVHWFMFAIDRFAIHRKPIMWVVFLLLAGLTLALSNTLQAGLLQAIGAISTIFPHCSDLTDWAYAAAAARVNDPAVSVIDNGINDSCNLLLPLMSDDLLRTLMLIGVSTIVGSVITLFCARPSSLIISTSGFRLQWSHLPFVPQGPLVPWSAINRVYVSTTHQGEAAQLNFAANRMPALYRLVLPMGKGHQNCFSLNLLDPSITTHSEELFSLLSEAAPPYLVETEAINALLPPRSHSYTELWLEALSSAPAPQRLEPLPKGSKLRNGKYTVDGLLGAGGQGTVYLAGNDAGYTLHLREDTLETVYAPGRTADGTKQPRIANVKTAATAAIPHSPGADSSFNDSEVVLKEFVLPLGIDQGARKTALDRFIIDAEMLRSLNDEHIVRFVDCFVEDHRGYLVMERIYGRSLRDLVEEHGPFSEQETLQLLLQMCDMLSYLQSQSPPVVHRDFTPDNLILNELRILKLVDFNIAQQSGQEPYVQAVSPVLGKPAYMPPEQVQGEAVTQSDLYAAGATAFFLLTGEDPEPLQSSHPAERLLEVSSFTDHIVAKATELDRGQRYQNASELKADVSRALHQ